MKSAKGIYIHTLGCPKNTVDSETLLEKLRIMGLCPHPINELCPQPDGDEASPDIILVNTCGFIQEAKKESIEEILRLSKLKKNGTKLVVFGCLAQRYKKELKAEIPEIDAIWGVGEEDKIVEYCVKSAGHEGERVTDPLFSQQAGPAASGRTAPYAYLKIAEGCDRRCTYCTIPSIRGAFRSMHPDSILKRAASLVSAGKKELIVISQDTASYGGGGKDLKGYDLTALLQDMASISGDFWIRLLYLHPLAVSDKLIETIGDTDKICKYLDIPLQHSEDRILKLMGRPGSKKLYRNLIKKIRRAVPDITLRSTFIAGFPGEEEGDFKGMMEFVEEIGFERLGVFKYSKEEGTKAASMSGHVSSAVKGRRLDELMRLQSKISLEKNKAIVGKKATVLVDEPGVGRLPSQAPEIDGVVLIKGNDAESQSSFVNVRITDAMDYDLIGVIEP